jgi:membrane-associated phospholipid phosphatase
VATRADTGTKVLLGNEADPAAITSAFAASSATRRDAGYVVRMRRRTRLVVSLLLLTAGQVVALVEIGRFFVHTEHGQLLDTIALAGNTIGRDRVDGLVGVVLNAMSLLSLAAATAVVGFIALIRRRVVLALVATLLVVGANVTTQLLKQSMERPNFGVDPERAAIGNSLPSGHTTVAASVAVALVLVLPPRVRGIGGLLGAAYAALAGVATLSAGWHRPSDAVASLLVVGAWAGLAGLTLAVAQRADIVVRPQDSHRIAAATLALGGAALLVVAVVGLKLTDQVLSTPAEELGRRRLFTAYAGSAAGIAGTGSLVMAVVLATVHRVVPEGTG